MHTLTLSPMLSRSTSLQLYPLPKQSTNSTLISDIMTRAKRARAQTGNVRKEPIRDTQKQYRHTHGLSCVEVMVRHAFQVEMITTVDCSQSIIDEVTELAASIATAATPNEHDELMEEVEILQAMNQHCLKPVYEYYEREETLLCDVPPQVHDVRHDFGANRRRTIDSLTDYEALSYTNFTKAQLHRIYRCNNLPAIDHVRCSYTQDNYYKFQGEELFLFAITKMCTGLDNTMLCDLFFGGSPRRWSNGFKWYLIFTNDRYHDPVLSMNGLKRETKNFPYYASKIARKFNIERFYLENHTYNYIGVECTTIDEENCCLFSFLDGSVTESSTWGTGAFGDYYGSMRHDDCYLKQRCIYSGYKKLHGLTTLALMLPTGIHYIYGPCSMRRSDISMMNMSQLDDFLFDLQSDDNQYADGRIYKSYADKIFHNGQCIRRAHKGDHLNPLTNQQRLENSGMNALRVSIENNFALMCNKWKICSQFSELKLGQEHPHAKELLAVCYLMANISVCLQGSQVAGIGTFFCSPPSLEEYLELGDEVE